MGLKRFFWIASTTVVLIASQTFRLNFPLPLMASPVVAQTSDVRKAEADRLLQQGLQQYQNSQFQVALQSFQQALSTYQKISDYRSKGVILNNIGTVYRSLRKYSQALEFYQQALVIYREVGDRAGEGIILSNIATLYEAYDSDLKSDKKPLEYYQQALIIAREVGDRYRETALLLSIGQQLWSEDKPEEEQEEVLKVFQQISAFQKELVNPAIKMGNPKSWQCLQQLGAVC